MKFKQLLENQIRNTNSLVCVGLDPDIAQIPDRFRQNSEPLYSFNEWIISQTHQHVCAYKPNSAFYEAYGASGIEQLKKTCDYLKKNHPEIPIILDAKRGDIGHTNSAYAKFIFEYLGADAVTLQPYLGKESLSEFFTYTEKGLIILCKTSNSGAGEFQDRLVSNQPGDKNTDAEPVWKIVATHVTQNWQKDTQAELLLVVGATYPEDLKVVRSIAPNTTFLVPGIGSQGGDLEQTLQYGLDTDKRGLIINSSRGIIYSEDPKGAVKKLNQEINALREQ